MEHEGLTSWSDHDLHRLGIRMSRILAGQEPTDDLAGDLARGNEAYRILYDRYADSLFGYVRDEVLFADEYQELAEDTVQAVFLQLWQREEPTAEGVELWGLLRCWAHDRARDIVRSYAKLRTRRKKKDAPAPLPVVEEDDHRRRQFNNTAPGQLEARPARDRDPARIVLDREIGDVALARLVNELPDDERRLVEDRYLKQVPIDELIDRLAANGGDRAACKRKLYLIFHRFRTRVRRQHPLTDVSVDTALRKLRRLLTARGIDADDALHGLREERRAREEDRVLLADMLVAVSRVRKRIARSQCGDKVPGWLDDLVFRLRLRTGSAELLDLVRSELDRVAEWLRGREVDVARELRPILDSLHTRELVAVGRQLRRIAGWMPTNHPRGVACLTDLLLELRLRGGGAMLDLACRGVQERMLGRIQQPAARRVARELLPNREDAPRWRKLVKLVLRLERARQAWTDEQVVAAIRKICRS